ncbi:MAG: sigma-70 family RNA polymerase sigma factor [Verrucomicrobia bacterium]|nr:sigma-70 family RNA polymerase sigma factor [Verrucomicrobiota bacterium]
MSAKIQSGHDPKGSRPHASTNPGVFQTTHWSLILQAQDGTDPELSLRALESLCRRYWQPIYNYLRRQGTPSHDAQDITQGFFTALLEKNKLEHADQTRGRFRSFLLTSLKNFHANERAKQLTQKRGGQQSIFSLDQLTADKQFEVESRLNLSAEEAFDRKWAQSVIEHAMKRLREEFTQAGTLDRYRKLQPFLLSDPEPGETYEALAQELKLSQSGLRSAVHRFRRRFSHVFQAEIADTVADPNDVEAEVNYLSEILSRQGIEK